MDVVVNRPDCLTVFARIALLPDNRRLERRAAENLVHEAAESMLLGVVAMHPHGSVVGQQVLHLFKAITQHGQPDGVL